MHRLRFHARPKGLLMAAGALVVLGAATLAACSSGPVGTDDAQLTQQRASTGGATTTPDLAHGRDVWFKSTFGGEKFFSIIAPRSLGLTIGFDAVLATPRASRFAEWGVINDPDCTDGDASTGYLDKCPDPNATGVVGLRKMPDPTGQSPFLVGASCAACHAGLDAAHPPADPNHPTWANIHPTAGNQFVKLGKLFGAHLSPHDPRYQVFQTWAPGTVDTTAIENDGINNPGIITQFFDFPDRPYFDNHDNGTAIHVHRGGQGGEDDVGCAKAALRVYFNIGMCAAECMLPHLTNGPGGTQTSIDFAECEARCPDFVQAEKDVKDECAFINDAKSTPVPHLADVHGAGTLINARLADLGKPVFDRTCASCHSNGQSRPDNVWSDDLMHVATGFRFDPTDPSGAFGEAPETIATNRCRALSTNWMPGRIWGEFASDELHARGPGYYRDVPLTGVWSTAPFFHNNRLGPASADPSAAGRVAAYQAAMKLLLNPALRDFKGSVQVTTDTVTLPNGTTLPAGTPVAAFANVNPATGQSLCDDYVENGGHYFGATLSDADKAALTEYVKTL